LLSGALGRAREAIAGRLVRTVAVALTPETSFHSNARSDRESDRGGVHGQPLVLPLPRHHCGLAAERPSRCA